MLPGTYFKIRCHESQDYTVCPVLGFLRRKVGRQAVLALLLLSVFCDSLGESIS